MRQTDAVAALHRVVANLVTTERPASLVDRRKRPSGFHQPTRRYRRVDNVIPWVTQGLEDGSRLADCCFLSRQAAGNHLAQSVERSGEACGEQMIGAHALEQGAQLMGINTRV